MAIRYPILPESVRLANGLRSPSVADNATFEAWCALPNNDLRTIDEFVADLLQCRKPAPPPAPPRARSGQVWGPTWAPPRPPDRDDALPR